MERKPKIPTPRFSLTNVKKDSALILMRVNLSGSRVAYSTGETINPRHWNKETRRAKMIRGRYEYLTLNQRLTEISKIAQEIFVEYEYGQISTEKFRQELDQRTGKMHGDNPASPSLLAFFEHYLQEVKLSPRSKVGTFKRLQTAFNNLVQFEHERGYGVTYNSIDWNFRHEFLEWLYAPPREHSISTAGRTIKIIKQVMREAYRRGYHSNQVFEQRGFGVRQKKTKNKVRLTFAELDALADLDLAANPRLERVRDLFLLGCHTGLRFSDWWELNRGNLVGKDADNPRFEIVMKKTDRPVEIPLLPKAKAILEKYDYQLPKISAQKFNEYIKEVCELAISEQTFLRIYSEGGQMKNERVAKWTRVSSHAARRSFATNYWEIGVPAPLIMQITGHTTEKQFFDYIDVSQELAAKRFREQVTDYWSESAQNT